MVNLKNETNLNAKISNYLSQFLDFQRYKYQVASYTTPSQTLKKRGRPYGIFSKNAASLLEHFNTHSSKHQVASSACDTIIMSYQNK